jgi:pimeloyl-ACP methyl ester carboxylesterase
MPMPKVQAGDIMMHYEVYGDGPPLVLLYGCGYQAAFWWLQTEVFDQHYRVIVPDNRSVGDTDAPNVTLPENTVFEHTCSIGDASW